MQILKLFCILIIIVCSPLRAEPVETIFTRIEAGQDLNIISKQIWEEILDPQFKEQINAFKKKHSMVFTALDGGATWSSLKKKLDVGMVQKISGAPYSWEEFRNVDKIFKEKLVNEALKFLKIPEVNWAVTGTVGYNSDIDNVAVGQSPYQEIVAKILMDTLHVFMYQATSDITFDEEVYTQHPGATLQTLNHLESDGAKEKYRKVAFSLEQLQLYRNLKEAKVYPWDRYKALFIELFPDVKNVLDNVEEFEVELFEAEQQDHETLENAGIDVSKINALIDLKAIASLSKQIMSHDQKVRFLAHSLEKERQQTNISDDLKIVMNAASKEKDDLLIQTALLYALRGTYFPESYFTQEAFQIIVSGDQSISQILSNMMNDYSKKGNPKHFKSQNELKVYLIENNKNLFIPATLFAHTISLGEQLGYFIHKIDSPNVVTAENLMKGGKYLNRLAFSMNQVAPHILQHNTVDKAFVDRLNEVAAVMASYQRGKIFISQKRLKDELLRFIKTKLPQSDAPHIAETYAHALYIKLSTAILTREQMVQTAIDVFNDNPELHNALAAKMSPQGIQTSDESITLVLNALIGKARHENDTIRTHFDREFSKACIDLKLVRDQDIQEFLDQLVKNYIGAVKGFYRMPENVFLPYSLNYNEIELRHTLNPADLIQEK